MVSKDKQGRGANGVASNDSLRRRQSTISAASAGKSQLVDRSSDDAKEHKKKSSAVIETAKAKATAGVDEKVMADIQYRSRSLRGVDILWLLLVRATAFNPVCASTYTFSEELDLDRLRDYLRRQGRLFPKYRQRLATPKDSLFHAPTFEDDPDYDVDRHLSVVDLPEPCGPKELDRFMSEWVSKGWDESKPLWDVAYIRKFQDGGQAKAAMVSRGHHTQADGQGFIMSALFVTSYGAELEKIMTEGASKLRQARLGLLPPSEVSPMLRHMSRAWENAAVKPLLVVFLFLLYWLSAFFDAVQRVLWSVIHLLYAVLLYLYTFWRVDMAVPVRKTPGPRQAVFSVSKPLKLADVKTMQHAFSGNEAGTSQRGWMGRVTVNDVLCSIMADVVGQAIERVDGKSDKPSFRQRLKRFLPMPVGFFIPISLRAPGQWDMRNLSTGSIVYLSSLRAARPSIEQIHSHIHNCKRSLNIIKRSYLPVWAFHCLQHMGQLPILFYPIWGAGIWQSKAMLAIKDSFYGSIISSMPVVCTNIPGPPKEAKLEGIRTLRWTALPPQGGRGTLGIGIITYNGSVSVTAAVDKIPGYEDTAERICRDFEERFKLYLAAAERSLED